jgi:hypothetical protein
MVQDSTGIPLTGTLIKLKWGKDSIATAADIDGAFTLNNVKWPEFNLSAAFLGFETFMKTYKITSGNTLNIPIITLKTSSNTLNEVVISAVTSIKIGEDTVSFNAAAYPVRQGDAVDEILRKLPGVKVDVDGQDKELEILYPPSPGSIYHMTKCQDALMFAYYNKNDKLRITDLHQGIVWGTQTEETKLDENLINRFDYDGDYGTVLNRFLIQAAVGHPITVHGSGGQTRAFINIQDTVKCLKMAIENPPQFGERVKIFNLKSYENY